MGRSESSLTRRLAASGYQILARHSQSAVYCLVASTCFVSILNLPDIFRSGRNITIENVVVDQAGGNGIFLSNHCWRTNIVGNTVAHAGDSAILLVGSTHYMNGTRDSYPAFTNISNNLCFEMGYYGKQTAAYFKSIAFQTQLVNNVFFSKLKIADCDVFFSGFRRLFSTRWPSTHRVDSG